MAARCRYPRLITWSCRAYAVSIWAYPPSLRRDFGRELVLTFRNQAEDALNSGSVAVVATFAAQLAADWVRTLTLEPEEPPAISLLGLDSNGGEAFGALDRSTFNGALFLASLGVVLLVGGWYGWLTATAEMLRHHR